MSKLTEVQKQDYMRNGGIPNDSDLAHREAIRLTMGFVADELGHDNPRFDREHFLAVVRGEKALTSRPPR